LLGKRAKGGIYQTRGRRTQRAVTVQPVGPHDEQPQAETPPGHGVLTGWGWTEKVDKVKHEQQGDE
jgi:hypothetical protein